MVEQWRAFGIRPLPSMSARHTSTTHRREVRNIVDERAAELARPLRRRHDRRRGPPHRAPSPVAPTPARSPTPRWRSSRRSTADQRDRAMFAVDAVDRRMWINVHMNHFRHGVMLEDLPPAARELGLGILRATLSARGFHQARSIMRINELLAELPGDRAAFGEWPYFLSIFGEPGDRRAVGLADRRPSPVRERDGVRRSVGAHPVVHGVRTAAHQLRPGSPGCRCSIPRRRPVSTSSVPSTTPQRDRADRLPVDHVRRHLAAAAEHVRRPDGGRRLPRQPRRPAPGRARDGSVGRTTPSAPRRGAARYVGWADDRHAAVRMAEVAAHLDETWFSWYGGYDDSAPFYYRVHSPVVLIEFDHHPGVGVRQRGAHPAPRAHGGAHAERRRLRRRSVAPAPSTL